MSNTAKRLVMVVMAMTLIVALPGVASGTGEQPGTGTPGYYHKLDHWPAHWAENGITVGGAHYTAQEAINIIKMPVKGDKTLTMFPALVAAIINVGIGNDSSCIYDTIIAAEYWMWENPPGSKSKANSNAWDYGEHLYWKLDAYNNGRLCAPSRG
jgi:hypothetical protein